MNRILHILALAGAGEGAWAFLSFGAAYFGVGAAVWLLALWAMSPLPLALLAARRMSLGPRATSIAAAGFALALAAGFALHYDAMRAFAAGREPLAGASVFLGPIYQTPLLAAALALAFALRREMSKETASC